MTAETSNARGEWVLVPREPTGAMIDAWRDAPNIWEDAYSAMLAAAPPPPAAVGEVMEFVRDIAGQKPEKPDYWSSCGQCESNIGRAQEVLEAFTAAESVQAEPKPEARGVVDDLIHAASNAATIIRNCVNAREIGEGYAQHADDIDAAIAALTGERNG